VSKDAHFLVDTRLTRLLGEAYRSSEAALKELVDNAWDADAENVWITLPAPLSTDPLVVADDGSGMTEQEVRSEYLNIASDKRSRTGAITPRLKRKVKGRKGIGKFSGLTVASLMAIETVTRGKHCRLLIDKKSLVENQDDLEVVPLPLAVRDAVNGEKGTKITLSMLESRLNFPTEDRLREILIYEYGREESFRVYVNSVQLSVADVPGPTRDLHESLPNTGAVSVNFTISDGKRNPRSPGIILKVDGKAVGKPQLFGLDEDEEIPTKLSKRVYGEVHISGHDNIVTADWGGLIENSKVYEEVRDFVKDAVKTELKSTHARDLSLQKARLQKSINLRLQQLPQHRRVFAQEAVNRILKRFYGETYERISVIADVALDAMEHDAYWAVLEKIGALSAGDVGSFAESLEEFGLLELSAVGQQATRRIKFLDYLDQLISNTETLEKDVHKALDTNLWVFGRNYSAMSSNSTLRSIIDSFCSEKFKGPRASKRPDLLLSQDHRDSYLLIEFKRPSHSISRDDIAQAEGYRDDLSARLSSASQMEILMIGRGKIPGLDSNSIAPRIMIHSYVSLISAARAELEWLIASLEQ
jgi:Histidine kinase-, DNA gyrase B-, and HSP90-like ATPase